MENRTIAAIATPTGRGGIGIIRISGKNACVIASKIFILSNKNFPSPIQSHHVYYGFIQDHAHHCIDEVLMIYMKGPRSYTAEDVVEIQSHSSPIVLRRILDLVLSFGADLSEPGEFTKRAFLNGRIDLTQAEAVIDIINARTSTSLDMAISQVRGQLKDQISHLANVLADEQAKVEALIDFPDDVGDILDNDEMKANFRNHIIDPLNVLKQNFDDSNIFRDGIKIIIIGPPNSGKSSLLNALLDKEKSIVTPIPGTTRDLIDDLITIDGIPFEITDTAGLQETPDYVEKIGIQRTLDKIQTSDLIILMFDGSQTLSDLQQSTLINLYDTYKKTKKIVVVENKIDLYSGSRSFCSVVDPDIRISVLQKRGLRDLKLKIADVVLEELPENRSSVVPNVRHVRLIENALQAGQRIIQGLDEGIGYELIAVDLNECVQSLGEIIGTISHEDILDRIFNSFCIGK